MVHPPDGSLHLQQKWWCIVAFVFLQLSAAVCIDAMLSIRVNLGEECPKATWLFVITKAGIDNKGVQPVAPRIVHDWFQAKISLKLKKGLKGIRRKLATFL
jgi:hypothetical protein